MPFAGVTQLGASTLAFANTACPDGECHTDIVDLATLLSLLSRSGSLDAETEGRLVSTYAKTPEGDRAVAAILNFRNVAIEVLEALRAGTLVSNELIAAVNKELSHCGCARELVRDGDGYRTETLFEINVPEDALMPIAYGLAELMTSVPSERLKQCREPRCTCYFVDTSKNGSRTWCSMERCGNRQKVANYYRRERERRK